MYIRHLVPYRMLGLCPVCWLAILISIVLIIWLARMLLWSGRKAEETETEGESK